VYDLGPALAALSGGDGRAYLNAKQLEGVAAALEAALKLKAAVEQQQREGSGGDEEGQDARVYSFPNLASLASGIQDEEVTTLRAIRHCIQVLG
jgi:hypothetical protein